MIRIAFTTNKDTVSANVTTVEKAADMLFMVLFAHGNDATRARADANALERAFKNVKQRRFDLREAGLYSVEVVR